MDPNGIPFGDLPWLAILLSWLALIVLGFVWYAKWSPTGRVWMRAQGMDPDRMPAPAGAKMAVSMGLMLVGSFLMMFVFAHTNLVYEDAFRNAGTGGDAGYDLTLGAALTGAFFTWLGFIVPINFNQVAFENKPWSLFVVNTGYYLVGLVVAAILIATLG